MAIFNSYVSLPESTTYYNKMKFIDVKLETRSNSRPSPDWESWCGRDPTKRDHLLPAVKPSSLVVYLGCSSQTDLVHVGNSKNSNGFPDPGRGPGSCSQTASSWTSTAAPSSWHHPGYNSCFDPRGNHHRRLHAGRVEIPTSRRMRCQNFVWLRC